MSVLVWLYWHWGFVCDIAYIAGVGTAAVAIGWWLMCNDDE